MNLTVIDAVVVIVVALLVVLAVVAVAGQVRLVRVARWTGAAQAQERHPAGRAREPSGEPRRT